MEEPIQFQEKLLKINTQYKNPNLAFKGKTTNLMPMIKE